MASWSASLISPRLRLRVIGVSMPPGWIEFTRMLAVPYSSAAVFVIPRTANLAAEVGRHLLAEVVEDIAEHDLGALADEAPNLRLALTPGSAGDDRDLAVEPSHGPGRYAALPCRAR